jgi:dihydrofolate reductase
VRKLIYSMGVSLDGFIAARDGDIDWSAPDEELHRFHNQQARETGAHLYVRRVYEAMTYWETADEQPSLPEHELEFARIWKETPKIVFSTTLEKVEGNARLVRDNAAEEIARLKEQPGKDLAVGGAGLASTCITPSHRRVPALRQSRRPGRRHAVLSGLGRENQPGAGRDAELWLARRLPSLPAIAFRCFSVPWQGRAFRLSLYEPAPSQRRLPSGIRLRVTRPGRPWRWRSPAKHLLARPRRRPG